jgi:5-formyltetrahydrofolate cyclo-ligase
VAGASVGWVTTPSHGAGDAAGSAAKTAVRDRVLTARRRRSLAEGIAVGEQLRDHLLATPEVRRAASVAAYVSLPGEPGTALLLDALRERGTRVLLPILLPDGDLDWAPYDGDGTLAARRLGLLEPTAPPLGPEAVAAADAVLVPGLAVDRTGHRLGRGGGSYDRVLARVPVGTFTCVLLHDDEVLDAVPKQAHDRPVTAVATPGGVRRFGVTAP